MMKIKTKKLTAGDYVTTHTNTTSYISKSYDGDNYWMLCDSVYYDDCDQINGYWDTYFTKKACLEVIAERERGA